MKKKLIIIIISVCAISLIFILIRALITPAYPPEWNEIFLGMKQEDVHKHVPNIDKSWIDVKGFEQDGKSYGESFWSLAIFYDQDKTVTKIKKQFVYKPLGVWNRNLVEERN